MELPHEFESRMQLTLGNDFISFKNSFNQTIPISVRLNQNKHVGSNPNLRQVLWEPNGFYLDKRPVFTLDPLFHAGLYYVQEASSMFTGYLFNKLVDYSKPINVLDLCGAPGGKSTQIASQLNESSVLVANEVIRSRAQILYENITKWGNPNVVVTQADPKNFSQLKHLFDVILVDAPCSGEGLFRRDNNAIEEWSVANTQLCAQRQQRIVADVWDALSPGGLLIYSTCTFNSFENEVNLKWLSKQFDATSLVVDFPESWGIELIENEGIFGYQFFPHKIEGEGFFIGVVQKMEVDSIQKLKSKNAFTHVNKELRSEAEQWLKNPQQFLFIEQNQTVIAIPDVMERLVLQMMGKVNLVGAGIKIAEIKGKRLIPQQELAFSWQLNKNQVSLIQANEYEGLQFLKKESIHFKEAEKGYNLVSFKQQPLGWLNNIGARSNNTYPPHWRIRMNLPSEQDFISQGFL